MKRFSGKVALVTGSTNGIGRATVILFANEGAKVTITGRDANASAVTKAECLKAGASDADMLELLGDITDEEFQEKLVKETIAKFGKLDILVNNHGGSVKEKDEQGNLLLTGFNASMKLNCGSAVALCLLCLPYLKQTKGTIVNVSSVASTSPSLPLPFYGMAKAALDHWTRTLAIYYASEGIRVNAVNPGLVVTAFFSKMGYSDQQREKLVQQLEKTSIPSGKAGEPVDIANLIAFLADNEAARYVTGQTIIIDGGTTLMQPGFQKSQVAKIRELKQ